MTNEELSAENERLRGTVLYCDELHKYALRVFEEYRKRSVLNVGLKSVTYPGVKRGKI